MTEGARTAVAGDLARLVELYREATEELRKERGGVPWAAATDRDRAEPLAVDRTDELVLAGTIDDVIVGYARAVVRTVVGGDDVAELTDVYVEPGARGVGVGAALLDAAIEWATARGCAAMDSIALPGMRDTKNFFEAAGLVTRLLVVSRSLA